MSNKQQASDIFGSGGNPEVRSFAVKQFINKMLFHWPLYIVCLMLAMALGWFYMKWARPQFQIYSKVLIKDYTRNNSRVGLDQLNLLEPDNERDIQAEMGLMSSIPIIEQVVTDLQLWVTYETPTKYHSYKDIYGTTPVQFKLIAPGRNFMPDQLDIIIANKDYFFLKVPGDTAKQRFAFKNNFVSSFGTWKLDTTMFLKKYIGKPIRITLTNPRNAVEYYQGVITEDVVLKSSDVQIGIVDEVPERGKAILNDLMRVYMDASVQDKRESSQSTLKFIEQRLGTISSELNNVENQYEGYKSNRGITEIQDQSSLFVGNANTNDKQIADINIKLSVIDGIERYINSNEGSDNPPATLGLEDPGLLSLIKQLTDLQMERTKLLATLPENNPLFNPINQQIKTTKTALRENLKGVRSQLNGNKAQLQKIGSGYQSSIRNVPVAQKELSDIKRMQGIKENLYTYLLQKKEEISLDYASTISDALIIDHAHTASKLSPVGKTIYAIAFLFGLLIPTGILFGRNTIKNRILSKGEIIAGTGLPILSEIVYEETANPIVVLNQHSYIGEQFRDLRTKLNYLHGAHENGKVTLFTSSIAGEGKSFVMRNLGTVLSFAGKKTILLELDLRRPTFHDRFKLDKTSLGLTDFLIGNATKAEIIHPSAISDNLFTVASGNIPPNPSELLESKELRMLIQELRAEYDHVLVDTPPIHLLTDAMIVAPFADVSLYLVRQDYTPKQELDFIRDLYREKKLPRLNLIFNAVKNAEYGSGYSYHKNSYVKKTPVNFKSSLKKFLTRF
jgi:capsular exopolysaccharide synthesis family protein